MKQVIVKSVGYGIDKMKQPITIYTNEKEYLAKKNKMLQFLRKNYSWYKNIEDGMVGWEKRNKLK